MMLERIKYLVIHHSGPAMPSSEKPEELLQKFHYVILSDATVLVGVPLFHVADHCDGRDHEAIGICVVGDNGQRESGWTQKQKRVLRRLVKSARMLWPHVLVGGHQDLSATPTTCPGISLIQLQNLIEREV